AVLGQQVRDAAPHDLVVVEEKHSDHSSFLPYGRARHTIRTTLAGGTFGPGPVGPEWGTLTLPGSDDRRRGWSHDMVGSSASAHRRRIGRARSLGAQHAAVAFPPSRGRGRGLSGLA